MVTGRHDGFLAACFAAAAAPFVLPAPLHADAPTPAQILERIQTRYRIAPAADRMRIEVRADSGRTARSWIVVRIDPRPQPGGRFDPAILLDLGPLRVFADGLTLSAVHERNPLTALVTPIPGDGPLTSERLAAVMPPVPLPQLDLIHLTPADHTDRLGAYARNIRWHTVTPDPRIPGRVTLEGVSDRGRVILTARNDQPQTLSIRDDQRSTTIQVTFTPEPVREEEIVLDTAGRARVARLSDLQPRSGVLRTGAIVPELQLSTAAGQVQRLRDLFMPPARFLPAPEVERLVLIFTRQGPSPLTNPVQPGQVDLAALGRGLARLQAEVYAPTTPPAPGHSPPEAHAADPAALIPPFNFAHVLVLDPRSPLPAETLLGLIQRERQAWGGRGGGEDGDGDGEHLAWTTDPHASIDLFDLSGLSLAVVIGKDQRLRAVMLITPRMTTEQLLDQIAAALMEAGDDAGG